MNAKLKEIVIKMQDKGYRIQDTGYRIHDTRYRIQDTRYRKRCTSLNDVQIFNAFLISLGPISFNHLFIQSFIHSFSLMDKKNPLFQADFFIFLLRYYACIFSFFPKRTSFDSRKSGSSTQQSTGQTAAH